jgi:cathepsin L
VTCDKAKNKGCKGGWPHFVLTGYMKDNGVTSESNFPYVEPSNTSVCLNNSDWESFKAAGEVQPYYLDTRANKEEILKYRVYTYGPTVVGIYATKNFQLYKSGILDDQTCKNYLANHAVLVVGYGSEDGKDYWLVKNSWGESVI